MIHRLASGSMAWRVAGLFLSNSGVPKTTHFQHPLVQDQAGDSLFCARDSAPRLGGRALAGPCLGIEIAVTVISDYSG